MSNLTQKQEAFAQAYIETGNASEAYRRAYKAGHMASNAIHVNASKLMSNAKVALRVEQLQQKAAKRHEVTVDMLTEKLWNAEKLAHSVENPSAAVSAVMGVGKLHGLIVDKVKGDPNAPVYINEIKMIVVDSRNDTEH